MLRWSGYIQSRDNERHGRLPIWEVLHRLNQTLPTQGESAAARLLSTVHGKADPTRQLAYRLYTLCERAGWAEDAREHPQTFEALASGEYLAVIHADGNGVGAAAPHPNQWPAQAVFYYRNRVLLRSALTSSINAVVDTSDKIAPLVLLMLGGDDILVVCRASLASRFVVALAEELDRLNDAWPSDFRLTLGVGVSILQFTIPFVEWLDSNLPTVADVDRQPGNRREAP